MDHNTTVADVAHKANDFEETPRVVMCIFGPLTRAKDLSTAECHCAIQLQLIGLLPKTIIRSTQWANGTIDKDGYVTKIRISMTARRLSWRRTHLPAH